MNGSFPSTKRCGCDDYSAREAAAFLDLGSSRTPCPGSCSIGTLSDDSQVRTKGQQLIHLFVDTRPTVRHTYATLLLVDGVSPAYVQEQLGHSSIELTVGTYGRWLRKKAPGAVDRLDAARERAEETPPRLLVAKW